MTNDLKTKIAEAINALPFADGMISYNVVQAALQAIHDAGFAVVPLVPTEAMLEAGFVHTADPCWIEDVAKAYRAMVSAAQHNTEEKT